MEEKMRHLEMIQGVINRLADNSFKLKEWTVLIVSALLVLSSKDADKSYIILSFFPVMTFWLLDAYYLAEETQFRKLYEEVCKLEKIDFLMKRPAVTFFSYMRAVISKTISPFYGVILVVHVVLMYYHFVKM